LNSLKRVSIKIKGQQLNNYTYALVINPHNVHVDDIRMTSVLVKTCRKAGNGSAFVPLYM